MSQSRDNTKESLFKDPEGWSTEFSQNCLIDIAEAIGEADSHYKRVTGGMCAGLTHAWMQAVLCEDEENYDNRTIFMNDYLVYDKDYRDYAAKHNAYMRTLDQDNLLPEQAKHLEKLQQEFKLKFENTIKAKLDTIHTKIIKASSENKKPALSLDDERWLEIEGYINKSIVYQTSSKNDSLFGKRHRYIYYSEEKVFAITASHELERRGGAVKIFDDVSLFKHNDSSENPENKNNEIVDYFNRLGSLLENVEDVDQIPLSLNSAKHRIGIKYVGKNSDGDFVWRVSDPNHMPSAEIAGKNLGDLLYRYLKTNSTTIPDTVMHLQMFTTGIRKNTDTIKKLKEKLTDFYKSNLDKENLKDLNKLNDNALANIADSYGHLQYLEKLDHSKVNQKVPFTTLEKMVFCEDTYAANAILQSYEKVININERINKGYNSGKTLAHIAAEKNDVATLRVLDKHHANMKMIKIDIVDFGITPMKLAKKNRHHEAIDFIESILRRDMLLNKINNEGDALNKLIKHHFVEHGEELKNELTKLRQNIYADWQACDDNYRNNDFKTDGWLNEIERIDHKIREDKRNAGSGRSLKSNLSRLFTKSTIANSSSVANKIVLHPTNYNRQSERSQKDTKKHRRRFS